MLFFSFIILAITLIGTPVQAVSNSGVTYHGRILKSDGSPLDGASVQFKLQIRSPGNESCLLYEEIQTLNMSNSSGVFSINLNDGTGSRDDNSGITFNAVFSNRSAFTLPAGTCAVGSTYLPNAADGRSFIVSFKDENMQSYEPLPAQPVNFAPTALQALQIAGFGPNNLFRVDDATAVANTTPLNNAQYNALMAVANGTAPYVSSTLTGGALLPSLAIAPATPASGALWYNSATNALQYYNGTSTQTLGTSSASGTVTSVTAGSGLAGGTITTSGTISLGTLGTAGTYYKVTTDSTGRVSSGAAALVGSDIPTLTTAGQVSGSAITSGTIAGTTAVNTSGNITTTGNVTGTNVTATSLSGNSLLFYNSGNTHKITLTAPALTADYSLIFPMTAGSAGYVLSTDGAGNLSWIAAASASLSSGQTGILPIANGGTGTANGSITGSGALTFAAGGTNQNVALTPSGTGYTLLGGNVGVGTASPLFTLDVSGDINSSGNIRLPNSKQLYLSSNDGNHVIYSNSNNMYFKEYGGNFHFFDSYAGSDRLTISGANVGIGTASPSVSLDLGTKTDALRLPNGTTAQEPATALAGMIRYNTSTPGIEFYNGAAWTTLSTAGASSFSGVTSISDSTGNITLAPQTSTGAVVVNSNTPSTSSTTGAVQVTGGEGVSGAIYAGTSINAGSSVTAATSMISPQIYGSTAASGNIKIDGTSNATVGNVLLASAGGNVGIGTTSPVGLLDLQKTDLNTTNAINVTYSPNFTANNSSNIIGSYDTVNLNTNYNLTGWVWGQIGRVQTTSGNTGSVASLMGLMGNAYHNGNQNVTGGLFGIQGDADNKGTGTVAEADGATAYARNTSTGTITLAQGVSSTIYNQGAGVITNASALAGTITNTGGGTITNAYGLNIGAVAGTNHWSIYASDATSPSYFAGNVGIGTTAPGATLDVSASGTPSINVSVLGTEYLTFGAASSAASFSNISGAGDGVILTQNKNLILSAKNNSGNIYLTTGNTDSAKVTVLNGGNVGIGTTSPSVSLDLGTKTDALRLPNGTTAQEPATALAGMIRFNTTTPGVEYYSGSAWVALGGGGGSTLTGVTSISDSSGNIALSPQSSTGAVVVNSGTPSTSSFTGAVQITGGEGVSGAIYAGTSINAGSSVTAVTSMITPQIYGSTAASGNLKLDGTSNATVGNVLLASAGGNVGIGTSSPAVSLDIGSRIDALRVPNGTTAQEPAAAQTGMIRYNTTTSQLESYIGSAWASLATSAGGASQWTTTGSNVYYNTGSVGIGTTSPAGQLTVSGSGQATSTLSTTGVMGGALILDDTGNGVGDGGAIVFTANNQNWKFGAIKGYVTSGAGNSVGDISFETRTSAANATLTDVMRLTSAGNVGIGTTSPGATLDVKGHIANSGTAATVGSCGTSPTISGNDTKGVVALGSGGVTACTITFNASYSSAPACVATWQGSSAQTAVITANPAVASLTLYFSTSVSSGSFAYHCMQ